MLLAIASGKGGTGKTTISCNLVSSIQQQVCLVDCDVEEPNCHIFIKPKFESTERVGLLVPEVDEEKCNACGECSKICEFNAIVSLKTQPLVFPQLCHGCGGCTLVCPQNAISEIQHQLGVVRRGQSKQVTFIDGQLDIGQALSPPLIKQVKKAARNDMPVVIDAPPGTSCPVIEAVKDSDFVVLVTEPTPFGLNDLVLAVEMVRKLEIPSGVIINRADIGDSEVEKYCNNQEVPILACIPNSHELARSYSNGELYAKMSPEFREQMLDIFKTITDLIDQADK